MTTTPQNEELFDVVDENDQVIGQLPRHVVHRDKRLHRAIHIFVFNSDGQLYIQKRSPYKDQLPNCWTTSCSGHVDAGEDYDTAAVRELREELDISLNNPDDLKLLFKYPACRYTGWEFVQAYRLTWNGTITFDPIEISEGRWIEIDKLEDWIARKRRDFAPSFRTLWQEIRSRES